ncbi:SagB family peptide dehydrogenase [Fulvivirga ligni]|uniref:SagB family peptide dehydrogenase n=1 Tax=Fulvivirga ligni TaxID=2904246 RepID=UPI001F28EB40|nr:SagB family peptide dehydrogenase [Fulvivirga ligni]UII21551.1 SagB family peptide dehydrogenase [Fulvivirga ligni]
MLNSLWKEAELSSESATPCWEIFHESSKTGHYDGALTNNQVVEEMSNLYDVFPYKQFPSIKLPDTFAPVRRTFLEAVQNRVTPMQISAEKLSLEQLKTILYCGYGVTRDNADNEYIKRPFRTVPSGGALYPLELYFYVHDTVEGLEPGVYHYAPTENAVQLIKPGIHDEQIAEALVSFQTHLAYDTSLLIFITAVFNRSVFKYKEKGYRFALLEAGHVAQNINLAATALDLGVINIGGFHDRLVDRFMEIDGLNHATIYMNGICKRN